MRRESPEGFIEHSARKNKVSGLFPSSPPRHNPPMCDSADLKSGGFSPLLFLPFLFLVVRNDWS